MKFNGIVFGLLMISQSGFSINYPVKKGEGHIGMANKMTTYSSVFDLDGEIKSLPKTSTSQWIITGNYGLSNKFNVSLYAPVSVENKVNSDVNFNIPQDLEYSGIGDPEIGLSYAFPQQNKIIAIATLKQSLGFGNNNQEKGLNTGYGDNATALYFDIHYQINTRFFIAGSTGVRNRNKGLSDDFLGEVLGGCHLLPSLDLTTSINGLFPFENGNDSLGHYGLYCNQAGYLIANATVSYNYNRNIGIALEYNDYLKGQLIGAEPIIGIKLSYFFKRN